jgi:hypothetical protein
MKLLHLIPRAVVLFVCIVRRFATVTAALVVFADALAAKGAGSQAIYRGGCLPRRLT